jgi:hypothetical protein
MELSISLFIQKCNNREHGYPLDLAEIGFLNGKSAFGLHKWKRLNYLKKIIKQIEDHPYNSVDQNPNERSDPRGSILL